MSLDERGVAWGRVLFGIAGLVICGVTVWLAGSIAAGNVVTLQMLVTVLSILTGFLLAIISMSGDPHALYPGSNRIASGHRREIMRALRRYQIMFYVYLLAIASTLLGTVLIHIDASSDLARWVERCTLGVGAAAVFWSLGLPTVMIRAQAERLDQRVDQRSEEETRKGEGSTLNRGPSP